MIRISNAIDVGGIRATITADVSGYNQAVDKAKTKAKELGEAGKQASSSFSALNSRMAELGASSSQIDKINDRLKKANPQILERQLAAVREELTKLGASSSEIDKITNELEKNAKSANGVSNEIRQLGVAYAGLAVAMGAVITKAVETSATFEQSMAKVKAITGATADEFERLRNQSIQLGATTVFTASQAADAQSYLAMAGFKTNQILEAMPGVLALAAAGQMDLARTSDIASNILTGFQLEASESMRVVDVMAKTMTNSNTNIEQLGYAMKYVAPIAASLGISIEETAAAIGKLSDAGIQGEMAGTQLRAILLRLVRPVGEASEVMDKLKINIKDASGGILPLTQIVGQLESAFGKLTLAQQAEAASIIAGTEAASGFLTLIKTGGATLGSFAEELENSGGTAQRIADTQMDTLKGSIEEMKSALESVGIAVGDKFAPAIRSVVDAITGVLLGFNNLNPALQTAIITFGTVTAAILGAVAAVYALRAALIALQVANPILLAVSVTIGLVAAGISALITSNNEAEESTRKFEQAQRALNEELEKSPLNRTVAEVQELQSKTEELNGILEERAELQRKINEIESQQGDNLDQWQTYDELSDKLTEIDEKLHGLGYENVEDATQKFGEMKQAVQDSIPALMEMKRAELEDAAVKQDKITQMEQLSARYKELAAQQSLDESQKQELIRVTDALKKQYPDLHKVLDEEGRLRVENIGHIDNQISAERQYVDNLVQQNIQIVGVWETQARAQKESIDAQIANLESLLRAMSAISGAKSDFDLGDGGFFKDNFDTGLKEKTEKDLADAKQDSYKSQETINDLGRLREDLKGGDLSAFKGGVSGGGIDLTSDKKKGKGKKGKKKKEKSAAELAREARKKAYDADIASTRFKSDMYEWDSDRQIKEYEKVQAKHKQHLKETVEDNRTMLLQLKRLREDSAKSRYDFSAEWIGKEERRMQDSYRSEVDIEKMKIDSWTRLRDRYKKDSDEYKKADEQVYQAKKKLVQAQFDFSSDWIAKESRRMEMAGKSDAEIERFKLDSWTRVRDRYAKDSEFYKKADEQVYQAKKKLIAENEKALKDTQKQADEMYKKQKSAIEDAKKADLKAIEERKKAALGDYDARIKAIDALIAKEAEFNADADYETKLAEKRARLALLESAVGPDGIKEREDIAKEIERMQLEHDRELRKRELESQKQSIQDEKSEREKAFEKEKSDTEAKYDALKTAFEDFGGDVKTIESAISEFRIQSNEETNAQILSDLDTFVSQYNAKMSQIQSMSAHSSELEEYNANKDAWSSAKSRGDSAEMARLNARNEEIRKKYGIGKDSGKLPSFDVGGVVPGPVGHPMFAVVHGGEAFFNQRQLSRLFAMLDAPASAMRYDRPTASAQSIVNHIDMSVNDAVFEDAADVQTLYSERERTARRLQTMGVKNV
ncbi:phage tail tape measure protein [Paenibacillus alvei]|uniref:Phage tail tape measure protein n=1 Tax=Paenibacillus alvei TaxID=44250 RepID=A0ABT4EGV4_PAEAL|nr:phage tail tape measure protein [Paenibacillus alvei]MCY9532982.1 phage tail tape measure protein [Paenibacillus alvei]